MLDYIDWLTVTDVSELLLHLRLQYQRVQQDKFYVNE
jgi:hypothetical protein